MTLRTDVGDWKASGMGVKQELQAMRGSKGAFRKGEAGAFGRVPYPVIDAAHHLHRDTNRLKSHRS